MRITLGRIGLSLVIPGLLCTAAFAAGGSRPDLGTIREREVKTPEQEALEHYNSGLAQRDRAWKLEKKLAQAPTPEKAKKIRKKIQGAYERAIREFSAAIRKNPRLHEAYSSLGYVLRKTGNFEASLESYDRALEIDPNYVEAIEYRAEAYLGLYRLDEAKQAYMVLFRQDRRTADQLLVAMRKWAEQQRSEPGGVDEGTLSEFEQWIQEREEIALQTASAALRGKRDW